MYIYGCVYSMIYSLMYSLNYITCKDIEVKINEQFEKQEIDKK